MKDKYSSFSELKSSEVEGAYNIEFRELGTVVSLMAPHAGKIEPGTSEICRNVAGNDFTYYLFEGNKKSANRDLHITSSRFDEPEGLRIARSSQVVVTFHGQQGATQFINVGGLAEPLCKAVIDALNAAGFSASKHSNPSLQGCDENNICNQGISGKGIQLEISRALRDLLNKDAELMNLFSSALRRTLACL
ncbi:poly-gamma-glutamate hydrolase family protein [Aeromonas veronii]|uniref:poly-gamma-glutamate hydrolase family protein n=1 Tax=Aeromonas veronii TaxID=654 RepID=UPI003D26082F